MLNKLAEDGLRLILDNYDGADDCAVNIPQSEVPEHISAASKQILELLKSEGYISEFYDYGHVWGVTITPEACNYFELQQAELRQYMPDILPLNAEETLKAILEADNPAQIIGKKFEGVSSKEENELRGMLKELEDCGLIATQWASNVPYHIAVLKPATTYFQKKEGNAQLLRKTLSTGNTIYNIKEINATGSNLVLGNTHGSLLSVENQRLAEPKNTVEEKAADAGKGEHKTQIIVAIIAAAAVLLAAAMGLIPHFLDKDGTSAPKNASVVQTLPQREPENSGAEQYNLQGIAYSDRGEYENAVENYSNAILLDDDYGVYYYNRGRAYMRLGMLDEAIADLETALALDPADSDFQRNLRDAYKLKD